MSRYDLDQDGLARILDGQPPYRVRQVWRHLYQRGVGPALMTDLPVALRRRLAVESELGPALESVAHSVSDGGQTYKWSWKLADGARIESVLMGFGRWSTVCVSTQAGCAMACGFCATGQAGFTRNLSIGEIVEQVIVARTFCAEQPELRPLTNVVFMGMGEPLANFDRVWGAVGRLWRDVGISARHLTISTVGMVPGIRRLTRAGLPVNLAVSLHAANDQLRDRLVPINRRYPLEVLHRACADYVETT
ncbi:MAG: 23S rRNA (adenine(2503)-C(2))-methyltransferase RlmN, partial [Acidimicrobiales bacterium]